MSELHTFKFTSEQIADLVRAHVDLVQEGHPASANLDSIVHSVTDQRNQEVEQGKKFDAGKTRWDLVPPEVLRRIADIFTYGAEKYAPDNWKLVRPFRSRYLAAAFRHIYAWAGGEQSDPESGMHHLAHAATNLIFLMWGEHNLPEVEFTSAGAESADKDAINGGEDGYC